MPPSAGWKNSITFFILPGKVHMFKTKLLLCSFHFIWERFIFCSVLAALYSSFLALIFAIGVHIFQGNSCTRSSWCVLEPNCNYQAILINLLSVLILAALIFNQKALDFIIKRSRWMWEFELIGVIVVSLSPCNMLRLFLFLLNESMFVANESVLFRGS